MSITHQLKVRGLVLEAAKSIRTDGLAATDRRFYEVELYHQHREFILKLARTKDLRDFEYLQGNYQKTCDLEQNGYDETQIMYICDKCEAEYLGGYKGAPPKTVKCPVRRETNCFGTAHPYKEWAMSGIGQTEHLSGLAEDAPLNKIRITPISEQIETKRRVIKSCSDEIFRLGQEVRTAQRRQVREKDTIARLEAEIKHLEVPLE